MMVQSTILKRVMVWLSRRAHATDGDSLRSTITRPIKRLSLSRDEIKARQDAHQEVGLRKG